MQGDLEAWLAAAAGTDEEFVERAWRLAVRDARHRDAPRRSTLA